jgi:hypothetical protein
MIIQINKKVILNNYNNKILRRNTEMKKMN